MYVCVCNAVTERQLRSESESNRGTVAEIYRTLGLKLKCGKCVPTARRIINRSQAEATGTPSIPAFAVADRISLD